MLLLKMSHVTIESSHVTFKKEFTLLIVSQANFKSESGDSLFDNNLSIPMK